MWRLLGLPSNVRLLYCQVVGRILDLLVIEKLVSELHDRGVPKQTTKNSVSVLQFKMVHTSHWALG
jgi:hypothetical protein